MVADARRDVPVQGRVQLALMSKTAIQFDAEIAAAASLMDFRPAACPVVSPMCATAHIYRHI